MTETAEQRNARIRERREAYRATFLHPTAPDLLPMAAVVLRDLRRVCCVDRPTYSITNTGAIDPMAMAMNEGKRMVWLRIQQALALDDETFDRMMAAATEE